MRLMIKNIFKELYEHAPFTFGGAVVGIGVMILCKNMPKDTAYAIFYTLHPLHVVLSAFVTSSMYQLHKSGALKSNLIVLLLIGYGGSIGVATVSDSIIPYLGEILLKMPNREAHIGFLEAWWLVNPLAFIGIGLAYFKPSTKTPHAAHVMVSTLASLFHFIMAGGAGLSLFSYVSMVFMLFIAVWVPCCFSDIVFPLLFVRHPRAACGHAHHH